MIEVHAHVNRVTVTIDGKAHAFNSREIEAFIAELGAAREAIKPPVPDEPASQPGGQVAALVNPRFWLNEALDHGGAVLQVRHPGFGWLGFHWPQSEAAKLAELIDQWGLKPPSSS